MFFCAYARHVCTFDTEGLATLFIYTYYIYIYFIHILMILAVRVYEVVGVMYFGFGVLAK